MPREVIHLSLGREACEISAHLLNLQGLAATQDERDDAPAPLCDSAVTHTNLNSSSNLLVPRALLIDDFYTASNQVTVDVSQLDVHSAWSGSVEQMNVTDFNQFDQFPDKATFGASNRSNPKDASLLLDEFFRDASALAQSCYSRYRVDQSTQQRPATTKSSSRHVDWDQIMEESEEVEEETIQLQSRAHFRHWQQSKQTMQTRLDDFWTGAIEESTDALTQVPSSKSINHSHPVWSSWRHYLMPPFHPKSILTLTRADDSYLAGNVHNEQLEERIRWLLEDCDSCQGAVVATSGHGTFAGLTTQAMEYLSDETPSSLRWIINSSDSAATTADSWRSRQVLAVRSWLESGVSLQTQVSSSHAFLPLSSPTSLPASPPWIAAALETAMLPYRLHESNRAKVSLDSPFYGSCQNDLRFGVASKLSFSEFIKILTPSQRHSILELDALPPLPLSETPPLWQCLHDGTSVQRDHRMKFEPSQVGTRRPLDVLPGAWLLPAPQGLLSSVSPSLPDRSTHQHFSLMSCIRGPDFTASASMSQYLTCLMEGMGIRYRPEQSAACVAEQSLEKLLEGGYAVGSYYRALKLDASTTLSVIGNSTRSYSHLAATAQKMKDALAPRYRGFYSRDIASGLLPEEEDCIEALSCCLDLRDAYSPPSRSEDEAGEDIY